MKKIYWQLLAVMGVIFITSCGNLNESEKEKLKKNAEDAKKELQELANSTADYLLDNKSDWRQKLDSQKQVLDKKITHLKEKAGEMTGDAKKDVEKSIQKLQQERQKIIEKIDKVKNATKGDWKKVQQEAEKAINSTKKAVHDILNGNKQQSSGG